MVSTSLTGGLGNFLFQICAAYSLALDNNDECVLNEKTIGNVHNKPNFYMNNIFRNLKFGNPQPQFIYSEKSFCYDKIPYTNNLVLFGYYQSEKYFKHNRKKILELLSIDNESKNYINKKYGDLNFQDCTSLHVRRGDYEKLPDHHPVCEISYFKSAVEIIKPNKLLIFSDDIDWCKKNLVDLTDNIIYIENNPDYIELWLMSKCKNNIISNSTFSWWAAWLNNNEDKKVISPNKWFGSAIKHEIKDLIPETWMSI